MDNGLAYLIPIIAIVGGITYAIFNQHFRTKRRIAEASGPAALVDAIKLRDETNAATRTRFDEVETRLGALERSVHDKG